MTLTVDFWQLVMICGALFGTVAAAFWVLIRMMLIQSQRQLSEQFQTIRVHLDRQDDTARRLEREMLEMKAELPRDYVRREDYTQAIASIMIKLDSIALRFENVLIRGAGRHEP
jgi:hypothetical protein